MLGIYTRISKDRPNQLSTEIQKEQGIALAGTLNLPYKLFEEEKGTSGGKSIADRKKLNEMVDGIYDGSITAVYFYNQDRSTRDEVTWFTLANLMKEKNVRLYENGIFIDLEDDNVYMFAGFKAIMDANFRRKTGSKIKDSLYKLIAEGKATNPVLSYGYKKDKKGYVVINKKEAKIVKRIFKMSLDGIGSEKTASIFNEEGIKTRYAKTGKGTLTTTNKVTGKITVKDKASVKWSGRTILQIIKSTWYYGERTYKGEVFNNIPPIFDKEYWDKVNNNLQKNRVNVGKKTHKYLLKGIIKCTCGCNMYGRIVPSNNEDYYQCSSKRLLKVSCGNKSINRPRVESFIWARFFKEYYLIKMVKEHFVNTDEKEMLGDLTNKLKILNHQIKTNDEELKHTVSLLSRNVIFETEADVELKRIRKEKNDLNSQILNLENQITTYKNITKSSTDITDEIEQYRNTTSFNDKFIIIKKYIKSIEVKLVDKLYHIKIEFNIPNIEDEYYLIHKKFKFAIEPKKEILISFDPAYDGLTDDRHFIRLMSYNFEKYL